MTTGSRFVPNRRALLAAGCIAGLATLLIAFDFTGQAGAAGSPDVTIFNFTDLGNYGASGGFVGYSVGTRSCNRGTTPLNWCSDSGGCAAGAGPEDHPVIAQNLYRLKDGRFDQIGLSWVKHGFLSTNSTTSGCTGAAGQGCTQPPAGSAQLGVGCTDPYTSSLNGSRPLGRRSEVNPTTGIFPDPSLSAPGSSSLSSDQRIKVATTDVNPANNAGALYFAEAQYIARDDASAGNAFNNASYQRVTVGASPNFNLSLVSGAYVGQLPAIYAWRVQDPTVLIADADVPGAAVERYHVARKVTDLGNGHWHYEFAVHNMNSDRSARAFTVQFPEATGFTNIGFKGVTHHSGEPYATDDWVSSTTSNSVTWSTDSFATNPNAHALRWATMFNFWFDSDQPPGNSTTQTIGLFQPGDPASVDIKIFDLLNDSFESGDLAQWGAS